MKRFYPAAWLLLSVCFVLFRVESVVDSSSGVVLPDTDPYYRLRRIERIAAGELEVPLRDPDLTYPEGFDVPWPLGLDLLLGIPLRVLGMTDRVQVAQWAAHAIPLLSLPTLWVTGAIASSVGGPGAALLAGTLLTFSPAHQYASMSGRIDHHFLEAWVSVLALFLWSRLRRRSNSSPIPLILLLGLAPSFWPQAWVVAPFLFLSSLPDRTPEARSRLGEILFKSCLLSLLPLFLSDRGKTGALSLSGFSWWTPFLYSSLSLPLFDKARWRNMVRPALFLGIASFLWVKHSSGLLAKPWVEASQLLVPGKGTLALTTETLAPLLFPPERWIALGLVPLVLAWVWFALHSFRKEWGWLCGYMVLPLLLALLQARFVPLSTPFLCVTTALLIGSVAHRIFSDARRKSLLALALLLVVLLPPLLRAKIKNMGNLHPFYPAVREMDRFLTREEEGSSTSRTESGVAAHWDFGHWILYDTGLPVVAHPFQGKGASEVLSLFCSNDPTALPNFLKTRPIRYLVLEVPTGRMKAWMGVLGEDPSRYFEGVKDSRDQIQFLPKKPFYNLFLPRWYFRGGLDDAGISPAQWRLVYVSPQKLRDAPAFPALKVMERVAGAHLEFHPREKGSFITAEIQTRGEPLHFRRPIQDQGGTSVTVPYGAYTRGGVAFDGTYALESPNRPPELIHTKISEKDVLEGRTIDLRLSSQEDHLSAQGSIR